MQTLFRLLPAGMLLAGVMLIPACKDRQADGEAGKHGRIHQSELTDSELSVGLGGISPTDVKAFRLLAGRFKGFNRADLDILWQSDIQHPIYGNERFVPEFSAGLHSVTTALDEAGFISGLSDPPEPTGDELFDRYALLVHQRLVSIGPDYADVYTAGWVPDQDLAEWEDDFGDDPRYWELRYLCTRSHDPMAGDLLPAWMEQGTGFLEESIERGIATSNTFLLLCQDLRQCHARRNVLTDPRADLPEELATRLMQLLDTAVEFDAKQAWPLYARAFLHFELGELEQGMDDLVAGNGRPVVESTQAFPMREIIVGTHVRKPPGGAAVSGALLSVQGISGYPRFASQYSWRNHMEAALTSLPASGKAQSLDIWFAFLARPGVEPGTDESSWGAEMEVFKIVIFASENLADGMTDTQVELVDRLSGWHEKVWADYQPVFRDDDWYVWEVPLIIAGKAHGDAVYFYMGEERKFRLQSELLNPYFADLKEVSFCADEIPASMLKYEPFTMEERERRGREKRKARDARVAAHKAAAEAKETK